MLDGRGQCVSYRESPKLESRTPLWRVIRDCLVYEATMISNYRVVAIYLMKFTFTYILCSDHY